MTKKEMLEYEVTHRHAGNGYACVQFKPEGDDRFVRVMSAKYPQQRSQAFLAAISHLEVSMLSRGKDPNGQPLPAEPVKIGTVELGHLAVFRDGLENGSLAVIETHVVPAKKAKP